MVIFGAIIIKKFSELLVGLSIVDQKYPCVRNYSAEFNSARATTARNTTPNLVAVSILNIFKIRCQHNRALEKRT
jgi:hypothetical protein